MFYCFTHMYSYTSLCELTNPVKQFLVPIQPSPRGIPALELSLHLFLDFILFGFRPSQCGKPKKFSYFFFAHPLRKGAYLGRSLFWAWLAGNNPRYVPNSLCLARPWPRMSQVPCRLFSVSLFGRSHLPLYSQHLVQRLQQFTAFNLPRFLQTPSLRPPLPVRVQAY